MWTGCSLWQGRNAQRQMFTFLRQFLHVLTSCSHFKYATGSQLCFFLHEQFLTKSVIHSVTEHDLKSGMVELQKG